MYRTSWQVPETSSFHNWLSTLMQRQFPQEFSINECFNAKWIKSADPSKKTFSVDCASCLSDQPINRCTRLPGSVLPWRMYPYTYLHCQFLICARIEYNQIMPFFFYCHFSFVFIDQITKRVGTSSAEYTSHKLGPFMDHLLIRQPLLISWDAYYHC